MSLIVPLVSFLLVLLGNSYFAVSTYTTQKAMVFVAGVLLFGVNLGMLGYLCHQLIHKKNIGLLTGVIVLKYGILIALLFVTFGKGNTVDLLLKGYLAGLPAVLIWGIVEGIRQQKGNT